MQIALIIISILLIAVTLLQAGKADNGGNALTGANSDLFKNRKERGGELFITRFTFLLGIAFFVICIMIGF